jgi:hypothetical protein
MERKKLNLLIDEDDRSRLLALKGRLKLPKEAEEGQVVNVAIGLLIWALDKLEEGYRVGAFGLDGKPNQEAFTAKTPRLVDA